MIRRINKNHGDPPITTLNPEEESLFQNWYKRDVVPLGLNPNPDDVNHYYDYRGYWKKYGATPMEEGQHFTDEYKLPGHSTFSNQSLYYNKSNSDQGGHWGTGMENGEGVDNYIPSKLRRIKRYGFGNPIDPNDKRVKKAASRYNDLNNRNYLINFIKSTLGITDKLPYQVSILEGVTKQTGYSPQVIFNGMLKDEVQQVIESFDSIRTKSNPIESSFKVPSDVTDEVITEENIVVRPKGNEILDIGSDTPLNMESNIITNHDSKYDYKKENGQWFTKTKTTDKWITMNGQGAKNMEDFITGKPINIPNTLNKAKSPVSNYEPNVNLQPNNLDIKGISKIVSENTIANLNSVGKYPYKYGGYIKRLKVK